jgi:hypothetical protein
VSLVLFTQVCVAPAKAQFKKIGAALLSTTADKVPLPPTGCVTCWHTIVLMLAKVVEMFHVIKGFSEICSVLSFMMCVAFCEARNQSKSKPLPVLTECDKQVVE